MANYLMQACVGGLLNYHAPFTNLTDGNIKLWDRDSRAVLRDKGWVRPNTQLALLYDRRGCPRTEMV